MDFLENTGIMPSPWLFAKEGGASQNSITGCLAEYKKFHRGLRGRGKACFHQV